MDKVAIIWTFRFCCLVHLLREKMIGLDDTHQVFLRCFLAIVSEQRCSVSFLTEDAPVMMRQMRPGSDKRRE